MTTHATHSGTAPSAAAHAAQSAQAAGARPGARKAGAQDTPDIFTQLLSLLSASADTPLAATPSGADPTDPGTAPEADDKATGGEAALAAMLQWADLPQAGAARSATGPDTTGTATLAAGTDKAGPALASAAAGGSTPANDALPPGMQVLDRSEAADGQTLAALPDAASGQGTESASTAPDPASALPAPAATAHRPAAAGRHATGPSGIASTQALQQSPQAQAAGERPAVRIETSVSAAVRSTVMLDERFALAVSARPAIEDDNPGGSTTALPLAATATAAPVTGASAGGDLAGAPGGDTDTGGDGGDPGHSLSDDRADTPADAEAEARAEAEERLDSFASTSLRQASLRVGESDAEAIDIRLSLNGQELDLGFRTDDSEARAALARHAQGNLSELLQRSGLQLGDVSVGPQGGQPGGGDGPGARPSGAPRPIAPRGGGSVTEAATPSVPRPRSDGSRPLDLFV